MRGMLAGLCVVLAGCAGSSPAPDAPSGSSAVAAPTSSRSAVSPSSSVLAVPTKQGWPATWTDEADTNYLAELRERGFDVTDEDDAILAGSGLCFLIDERGSLVTASAETMDNFDYTPAQIKAVTGAALSAYCPEKG